MQGQAMWNALAYISTRVAARWLLRATR